MIDIKLGNNDPFYAPAGEDCWVVLARTIMESYADKYACQVPLTAFTQAEYDQLNEKTYAPIRKSILRNIKNGPLKNAVDMHAIYRGLEERRHEYLKSMGVRWKDTHFIDVDNL